MSSVIWRQQTPGIRYSIKDIALAQDVNLTNQKPINADEQASRNLVAQETIAFWSMISTIVAILGVMLSAGGLVALLFSLRLNRQATLAAEAAVVVAQQANAAQSRAWVSVRCELGVPEKGKTHFGVDGIYFNVTCTAENHGHSPATGVSLHVELALLGFDCHSLEDRLSEYCDQKRMLGDHEADAIFPGTTIEAGHTVFLPLQSISESMNGKDFICPIIYGCLNYKTPYVEGVRQTRFGYYVVSIDKRGIIKTRAIMPNESDWLKKPIVMAGPPTIIAD